MYQGRRGGLAGQIITDSYFRYYVSSPPGVPFMAVDPAISKKTTADETAIVIANVDLSSGGEEPGSMYVRWYWHGRVGIKRQEEIIQQAWSHYAPVAIGIEAVAYQTALVELLEADSIERELAAMSVGEGADSEAIAEARRMIQKARL